MLPDHFPPHQTAYRWFTRFRDDGTRESRRIARRIRLTVGKMLARLDSDRFYPWV
jgi:hypothetical protein